ncbi:MAG: glycosyl hydrolase [Saprospiraceae bacterium]|nr:glycosyl hydrolase [Saprospiraceae bacterium]
MPFRAIGPAFMTGRISDVAKDPNDPSTWYVAVASGNVWKTENNATTWTPIFENYGSFSTGCIAVDPSNPSTVWLGSGENQSQRSASWGDGVYKSVDGGKSWQNMGLERSEHIGRIVIHPTQGDVIWVAAQGPLWSGGGDRGIFKSEDGGVTWKQTLDISEHTGASEIVMHPSNPDILYASTYQRRRHVGILVAGGEESRIFKSTDGGDTWHALSTGLPGGDIGRISLAISPQRPEVVYAQISKSEGKSGFYRSADHGASWKKMSDYALIDPQYYGEIYADPHRFDCIYIMDMQAQVTHDGGKTFERVNSANKHVDNHSLLFDPADPNYLLMGCDGGLYESFDRAKSWHYHSNLPITQFYRVGLDNASPIYRVYGGTQDNSTLGGPSRSFSRHGITNHDWELVLGGDGFQARVDPTNPNTVYAQYQYAGLVRYDRATGHRTELQPQPPLDADPLRWHWDAPLLISHHNPNTLYYAAQHLYKSPNRGDAWQKISPDLSRAENRNEREVMGKLYPPEAVWKNVFTSPYGTVVSLSESRLAAGQIAVGTDDGLIQVTTDDGRTWRKTTDFPGVPVRSYVADVFWSWHHADELFAVFNNHKEGDFKPYVCHSKDAGITWTLLSADLPSHHACWSIYQDHLEDDLLFLGTEFGLWCSLNKGESWTQMKGNLPTIPVRDIEIQQRENDLVLATFGRGMYILDDYSLLRDLPSSLETALFPIKNAPIYIPKGSLGYGKKGVFGDNFYSGDDVLPGVTFNLYLHEQDLLQTNSSTRTDLTVYPTYDQLKQEDFTAKPKGYLVISDTGGRALCKVDVPLSTGYHRISSTLHREFQTPDGSIKIDGPILPAGAYSAQMMLDNGTKSIALGESQTFQRYLLKLSDEEPSQDHYVFYSQVAQTYLDALSLDEEIKEHLKLLADTRDKFRIENPDKMSDLDNKRQTLLQLQYDLRGDRTLIDRFEYYLPSIMHRLRRVRGNMNGSMQITETHRNSFAMARQELSRLQQSLTQMK